MAELSESEAILALTSSSYHHFSLDEIVKATKNFDEDFESLIMHDYHTEYEAYLSFLDEEGKSKKPTLTCVKQFSKSTHGFQKDVRTMMKIKAHRNLFSLLGYCTESGEQILVYEYWQNASLSVLLNDRVELLPWKLIVKICLGVGYGLRHLHSPTTDFPFGISHGNLELHNIRFDENYDPKITEFTFSNIESSSDNNNKPKDVKVFGYILKKALCWDEKYVPSVDVDHEDVDFFVLVKQKIDLVSNEAASISSDSIKAFSDALRKCLKPNDLERATIDEVVLDLEAALNFQEDFISSHSIPTTVDLPNSSSSTMASFTGFRGSETISEDACLALKSSSYRQVSPFEIIEATNNFQSKSIYLCTDPYVLEYEVNTSYYDDDYKLKSTLAYVKRFYKSEDLFGKEVRTMMKIKVHTNLISLIGYCIEWANDKILVYEYMENGSLEHYLEEGDTILCWKKRVKICLDVAYGLQHLHASTPEFPFGIPHGDVSPANILLDKNWDAKLSNFFRTPLDKISSTFEASDNNPQDVYHFGIILIMVLCWDNESPLREFLEKYADNDFGSLVKKSIFVESTDDISPDSLNAFSDALRKCLHADRYERPSIDAVVLDLKAALNFQEALVPLPIPTTVDLFNSSSRESRIMGGTTESDSPDQLNETTNNLNKITSSSSSSSVISSSSSSLKISSSSSVTSLSSSSLNMSSSPSSNLFSPSYRQFSIGEINEVTDNLAKERSLRAGLYWIEYLVQMSFDSKLEKTLATVKQFKRNCSDEFEKEIQMAIKIQAHPNIISLLGYCIESGEHILIYNYPEHGSLVDYVKRDCRIQLSWKARLNLCLGAASGLEHLHKVTNDFHNGLIHGDVNPANILLGEKWVAKVSNYAGSDIAQIRFSFSANSVEDPLTRYAPEYVKSNHLTKKVDVYAFGIVLFQVLCRRRIWVQGEESKLGYIEENYTRWAKENVDISIRDGISNKSLKAFTDCIGKCLESNPYRRPSMERVVCDMETALNFQEGEGEANNLNASFRTKSRLTEGETSMSGVLFSLSSSSCRRFPLNEIKVATNNFEEETRLGKGGEGTVYLAEIHLESKTEKVPVAVKLLNKDYIGEFEKEIVTVTKIKHPNIVSLLGYCRESDDKVLIYEYMGKGSLSDYVKMNSKVCLSWKQRINICLGAAYGLQHLHRETEEFPYGIIHRDVKPDNILINDNWDAKVSDFGMLKLSNVSQTRSTIITTHTIGTPGYFAPECSMYSTKQLTRKIDVYSFGLVMFEVLCQKRMWETGESVYIDSLDVELLADENIDIRIKHQISESSKYMFIDTIAASLTPEANTRLSMNDVVLRLEAALKDQEESEISKEINTPS